jgi:glucose uptake protein
MFVVSSYGLAVVFCFVTMLCWGSWGNTQKLAGKTWRYELYYWDFVIGILVFSLIIAFTMGSFGSVGRSFLTDLGQAEPSKMGSALIGGFIFNLGNILLAAGVSLAGLSVAFPLGVGLALVLGVIINYLGQEKGNAVLLFAGVALIVIALICNGLASNKANSDVKNSKSNVKGIVLALVGGVIMAFFYRFVAAAMDVDNFVHPAAGRLTPYTALVIFALGIFISNFVFNTLAMKKPFMGEPVKLGAYFKGSFGTHMVGLLGGFIWCLGTALNYISSGQAGTAISYALGQGAPMIAAIWGIFIWKEFRGTPAGVKRQVNLLNIGMFVFFIAGLALIIVSGGS